MNKKKLGQLERAFLTAYPGGFSDPVLQGVGKKHKMDKMVEKTRAAFRKVRFNDDEEILEQMIAITCQSSMVSLFEKPKYRDCLRAFSPREKAMFADAFRKRLHGNKMKGFHEMCDLLAEYKLAKWSLMSILPLYFKPEEEVFVKPTTAKQVLAFLDIDDIQYKPRPSWEFYEGFKAHIDEMKALVDPCLSPNNAAFTGFLMMAIASLTPVD